MSILKHEEVLELWPSYRAFALDLGQELDTVMKWKYRKSIPAHHWVKVVEAAQKRDLPITFQILAKGRQV